MDKTELCNYRPLLYFLTAVFVLKLACKFCLLAATLTWILFWR